MQIEKWEMIISLIIRELKQYDSLKVTISGSRNNSSLNDKFQLKLVVLL